MKLQTLVLCSLIAVVTSSSPILHAQTFSVIHAFNEPGGVLPSAGITLTAGALYGTTLCQVPPSDCGGGTVYQLTPAGSNWYYAPILIFSGQLGNGSRARVVFGPDNQLYGTTRFGDPPEGDIFKLTPRPTICRTANCFWPEEVLHQFEGSPDGWLPGGDLVWDTMGNIYGTTTGGGLWNRGTVYEMTKSGNTWTETPIYSFGGLDGESPDAGVIIDGIGNLFGTTSKGGLYGRGTIFESTYVNGVGWTETALYSFQNSQNDGWYPVGLVEDNAGNLYGATNYGGAGGGGTIFELSPIGDRWVFTLLYSLSGYRGQCGPYAPLTLDSLGNLYGTTFCDGAHNLGNVFKLSRTQNGWTYTSLHDFTGGTDGGEPISNVTIDTDGTLYGTALYGGNSECHPISGCGVVWMIKP